MELTLLRLRLKHSASVIGRLYCVAASDWLFCAARVNVPGIAGLFYSYNVLVLLLPGCVLR